MPVTVVPDAAVQVPHQLMRNHQLLGAPAPVNAKSTVWSLLTVADRVASAMVKIVSVRYVAQLLSPNAATPHSPAA